jgi:hypothetical protein
VKTDVGLGRGAHRDPSEEDVGRLIVPDEEASQEFGGVVLQDREVVEQ